MNIDKHLDHQMALHAIMNTLPEDAVCAQAFSIQLLEASKLPDGPEKQRLIELFARASAEYLKLSGALRDDLTVEDVIALTIQVEGSPTGYADVMAQEAAKGNEMAQAMQRRNAKEMGYKPDQTVL